MNNQKSSATLHSALYGIGIEINKKVVVLWTTSIKRR